jgi:hypothetical protein
MKKLLLTLTVLSLVACGESDEDKQKRQTEQILAQQQQILQNQQAQQQQIEQQGAVVQQQNQQIQQQAQQPAQAPVIIQQPVAAQQPVVVQQHDNTMTNMLVGGLAGYAIANSGNNSNTDHGPSYNRDYGSSSRTVTNVTKNITINQPAPVTSIPVAPKVNSMDTSKFSSVKPSAPISRPSSGMNMSKLSSSGRR